MSNKIQINCNIHNNTQKRLIKFYEERIKLDIKELKLSQLEEKELILTIQKQKQNKAIQIVKLGKIQKRIDYIKKRIRLIQEWKQESLSKLIIC